jgi:hypothetical protein
MGKRDPLAACPDFQDFVDSMDFQQLTELETVVRVAMARQKRDMAKAAGYAFSERFADRAPESYVTGISELLFNTPIGLLKVVDLEFEEPTVTLNNKKVGETGAIGAFELDLIVHLHGARNLGEAEWEVMRSVQKYRDVIDEWTVSAVQEE